MRKLVVLLCFLGLFTSTAFAEKVIMMSTTTSTQASGLLDVLLPAFKNDTGIEVRYVAKGTGAALQDGKEGNVDIVLVHAPALEKEFVAQGFGTKRYPVAYNDFIIVGPASDVAKVGGMTNATAALLKIVATKAVFVSRGDASGTHFKEQTLWKQTGLKLKEEMQGKKKFVMPENMSNYLSIGQGMGKTLILTNEKQAYTLSDRATYLKFKDSMGKNSKDGSKFDLQVLVEKDPLLYNPYAIIPINVKKFPGNKALMENHENALKFAQWLISPRGQKLIADYKLLGVQLFHPLADQKK